MPESDSPGQGNTSATEADTRVDKPEVRPPSHIEVNHPRAHWRATLIITLSLLAAWFVASFVTAILLRDWFDANFPKIGNAPFGFWMAQQGSIICFVLILIVYARLMNQLDRKHGYSEE